MLYTSPMQSELQLALLQGTAGTAKERLLKVRRITSNLLFRICDLRNAKKNHEIIAQQVLILTTGNSLKLFKAKCLGALKDGMVLVL